MDLTQLPFEIVREIFVPAEALDKSSRELLSETRNRRRLILSLRRVCKRWKSMAERLPVLYAVGRADGENEITRFHSIFPACRALRLNRWAGNFDLFDIFSRLNTINIHTAGRELEGLGTLKGLTRLKKLWIASTAKKSEAAHLRAILSAASQSLEHLTLRRCPIENFSYDNLPNLKTLDLTGATDIITSLSALKHLRHLSLSKSLQPEEYSVFGGLTTLERLVVTSYRRNVSIDSDPAPQVIVPGLSRLTRLIELDFPNLLSTDESLRYLHPLKRLTYLSAFWRPRALSATALIALANALPNLDEVENLQTLLTSDQGCEVYCAFRRMEVFNTEDTSPNLLSDAGFVHISSLRRLRFVSVQLQMLGGVGMNSICSLPRLQRLRLDQCPFIPPASFFLLSQLTCLHELALLTQQLPPEAISCIVSESLTHLDVSGTGVQQLDGLSRCTALTTLNVSGTAVTDVTLRSLSGLQRLSSLMISGVELNGEGFIGAKYASCLQYLENEKREGVNPTLAVTEAGARAIAKLTKISSLCLFSNIGVSNLEVLLDSVAYKRISLCNLTTRHLSMMNTRNCSLLHHLYLDTHEQEKDILPYLEEVAKELPKLRGISCTGPHISSVPLTFVMKSRLEEESCRLSLVGTAPPKPSVLDA